MTYAQPKTTYSDTTPQKRVISDAIFMIDPVDVPFIFAVGGLDAARSKFKLNLNGTKIEILEDEYDPLVATAASTSLTNSTTLTQIDVTTGEGKNFQDGHVIQIDAEYMVVKSVSTDELTVYSRSYGGTNATHASTSAITIVGMARLEGDDADYGPLVDITAPYNYTSIFQKGVKVSDTERVIDQYGFSDAFVYQSNKAVPHLMRLVDRMAFHGVRAAGSASAPRSAGGLETFITSNTTTTSAIAKAYIDSLAQSIYEDGGYPDILVCDPAQANAIRDLIDTSSFVRVGQENSMLGMVSVGKVNTQFGSLSIVMDRHCRSDRIYLLSSSKVGFYQLRPFAAQPLARTGDSSKGEVVGEFALMVANNEAHGKIVLT